MSGDNASSRDSAVIDDDLVEALGFEPTPLDSSDVDEKTTGDADAASSRAKASNTEAGDSGVAEVAPDAGVGEPSSAKRGVVILGDVTPVDAKDPVAADIASAVLDEADLADSVSTSASPSLFGERSASKDELAAFETSDDSATLDSGPTGSEEKDEPASEVDVPQIESAFPEVPALDDAGLADSKLDDRELLTRPVEVEEELVEIGQDLRLESDDEVEAIAQTELEAQPTAVGVAPARSGYRRKRVRARKTRRVVRHIDPWSVLTFSILFHLAMYTAFLLASVLVWKTLESSGMVENIEDFIIALGDYETYEINADVLFRAGVIIAGILTVASTILSVLLCVVFNLISDLVGGIRVTVLEEETVRLSPRQKRDKTK